MQAKPHKNITIVVNYPDRLWDGLVPFVHILAYIVLFVNRLHSLHPSAFLTATVGLLAYQPDCSYNFGEGKHTSRSLIPRVRVIFNRILAAILKPINVSSLKWNYGDENLERWHKVQHVIVSV